MADAATRMHEAATKKAELAQVVTDGLGLSLEQQLLLSKTVAAYVAAVVRYERARAQGLLDGEIAKVKAAHQASLLGDRHAGLAQALEDLYGRVPRGFK